MTIIATCGHETTATANIIRKGYTREGERCLSSEVVCQECYLKYRAWGELLDTEEEEQAWLHGGDYHGEGTA